MFKCMGKVRWFKRSSCGNYWFHPEHKGKCPICHGKLKEVNFTL